MTVVPLVGDPAPDANLIDLSGRPVSLSSFWQAQPVVLVFLRYFGCPFCQAQVVALREDQDRIQELGGRVVLVGQGSTEERNDFVHSKNLPFPCLIDPHRAAYAAYGLGMGTPMQVFGPRVAGPFLRTGLRRETRQRGLKGGRFMQMPGTFVVDASGLVRFAHRNRTVADSPRPNLILDALAAISRHP